MWAGVQDWHSSRARVADFCVRPRCSAGEPTGTPEPPGACPGRHSHVRPLEGPAARRGSGDHTPPDGRLFAHPGPPLPAARAACLAAFRPAGQLVLVLQLYGVAEEPDGSGAQAPSPGRSGRSAPRGAACGWPGAARLERAKSRRNAALRGTSPLPPEATSPPPGGGGTPVRRQPTSLPLATGRLEARRAGQGAGLANFPDRKETGESRRMLGPAPLAAASSAGRSRQTGRRMLPPPPARLRTIGWIALLLPRSSRVPAKPGRRSSNRGRAAATDTTPPSR